MGKKKFVDKKKSATFQLLARDSSDPNYDPQGPSGDRVFIRVDNNQYAPPGFGDEANEDNDNDYDPDSIFADAPEDDGEDGIKPKPKPIGASSSTLPENIRREILELGLPDDGYNYLLHLREIKKSGGGSAYYENSKAKLDQISHDVKVTLTHYLILSVLFIRFSVCIQFFCRPMMLQGYTSHAQWMLMT